MWSPPFGAWLYERRTLRCRDGTSLRIRVKLLTGGDIVRQRLTSFGEGWVVTGGTGRFAHVRGDGVMFEPRADRDVVGGEMTGYLRRA